VKAANDADPRLRFAPYVLHDATIQLVNPR
jgi:hypothetical protein